MEAETPTRKKIQIKRWVKTGMIVFSYLLLGFSDTIKGPTLLDLTEVHSTDIDSISFGVLLQSIGSVSGALSAGSVLILDIWKGFDTGPYMHFAHFCFGIGAFIAPFVAVPFLSNGTHDGINRTDAILNRTDTILEQNETLPWTPNDETRITTLYPILAGVLICSALGFLYFGIAILISLRHHRNNDPGDGRKPMSKVPSEVIKAESQNYDRRTIAFIVLLCSFFFVYAGIEIPLGVFLTTFAVESNLKLSKQTGAEVTAIFWGGFSAMRFFAIFAAIKFQPVHLLLFSFALSLAGSVGLAIWADSSLLALQICVGIVGIGIASNFATVILWAEEYIVVTNRICSAFTVASSVGANVFPILVGHAIEEHPMFLMYLTLSLIVATIGVFGVIVVTGKKVKKKKEEKQGNENPVFEQDGKEIGK